MCERHAASLPPPLPADAPPARIEADTLRALGAFNATDAALDAAPASGGTAGRVRELRRALLGVRDAFTRLRGALAAEDLADVAPSRRRADGALDALDAAASAVGVPECASGPMGRPLLESAGAAAGRIAAATLPSGDFRTDLARACRALPGDLRVPARYRRGPAAQGRAVEVRQAVQRFEAAVRVLEPDTAARIAARRAALGELVRAQDLLLAYVESVGIGDREGARLVSGEIAGLLRAARARLGGAAGVRC